MAEHILQETWRKRWRLQWKFREKGRLDHVIEGGGILVTLVLVNRLNDLQFSIGDLCPHFCKEISNQD